MSIDWVEGRLGRFPRPKCTIELPARAHLRGLLHPFDRDFDEYYTGPTLEEIEPIETVMQYQPTMAYFCNHVTTTPWTLFKDYGYRLLPCFAQLVDLGKPFKVGDHLCPVGLEEPPRSITGYHSNRLEKGRNGKDIRVNDHLVVGLEDMMELAEREGKGILLTGKTKEGQIICLDLLLDAKETKVTHSTDIDSLVWITRKPKFKGPIGIYTAPVMRDRAPIWKNNHISVDILYPPSEEDRFRLGDRTEWFAKAFSLSTIPHLFGTIAQVTGVSVDRIHPTHKFLNS